MITRKIIKTILPNALPMAVILIGATLPCELLAHAKKVVPEKVKATIPASNDSAQEAGIQVAANTDSRVKGLVYNESNVYVIRTKYGYQTNIVFDEKEEIQTISVGDRSLWQIIPAGSRLFIRPMTENISTNMTLLTNKHSYEFDLKSVDEKNESNVYVVRFTYPEKTGSMTTEADINNSLIPNKGDLSAEYIPVQTASKTQPQQLPKTDSPAHSVEKPKQIISDAASPESIGLLPMRFNYSYTYAGPDSIAPTQVYDDGKSTFIKYKSMGNIVPNAFIVGSDGKESPIPLVVQGLSLIIDGVAGEIALRGDSGEIRIYNESLNQR
jgi:type IV secretion system protein VirB9